MGLRSGGIQFLLRLTGYLYPVWKKEEHSKMRMVKYCIRRGEELRESESFKYLPCFAVPDNKLVVLASRIEFGSA